MLKKIFKFGLKLSDSLHFGSIEFLDSFNRRTSKMFLIIEDALLEYNKTIITLSSSILILSFSLIKVANININKTLIGISWLFFIISIFCGVTVVFFKYYLKFADVMISEEKEHIKHGKKDKRYLFMELKGYYLMSNSLLLLSIINYYSFFIGLLFLMICAFIVI